jgi:hypothetical protein
VSELIRLSYGRTQTSPRNPGYAVFEELGDSWMSLEKCFHLELAVAGLQLGRGPVSGVFVVGFQVWF